MSRYLETSCQSKGTGCWKRHSWFTHRRNIYAAMRRIALEVVTKIAEVDAMCVRRTWSGSHIERRAVLAREARSITSLARAPSPSGRVRRQQDQVSCETFGLKFPFAAQTTGLS